jgi:hypothetical protein
MSIRMDGDIRVKAKDRMRAFKFLDSEKFSGQVTFEVSYHH